MPTRAITPPRCDDHMITLLKPRRFGNDAADLAHHASDLMTNCDGRRNVDILAEISVDELHIGTAHSAGLHVDENFVRLDIGNWYVLEDRAFAVLVHACCFHIRSPFCVSGIYDSSLIRRLVGSLAPRRGASDDCASDQVQ